MLKLQSKGGKFDIVLSDASLKDVGGVKKTNVRSLSSAGRRKTKEVKGNHILPDKKDASPRVVKGRESHLVSNGKQKDEKTEKKMTSKLSDKPSKVAEQRPHAGASRTSGLTTSKKKPGINTTTNAKRQIEVADEKKKQVTSDGAGVITQSELMTIIESLRDGDASLLRSIAGMKGEYDKSALEKSDSISKPYAATYSNLSEETIESSAVPENKPKDLPNTGEEALVNSGHSKSKDSMSTISLGDSQMPFCDTPRQNSSGTYASSQGRAERVAMRSSFAVGAPGQVTYDYNQVNRERNKQWLADLEKQIQEKKQKPLSDKERLARAMESPASLPPNPHTSNQRVESITGEIDRNQVHLEDAISQKGDHLEADLSYQTELVGASPISKGFARGQHSTKDQFELDEMERQKRKILEHQRAVEQQVEEKRKLKMIERERRIREELREEEKFAKEREQMALQYEQESRKQMEREEAERQRHEALQKSVLEAYDAAKREKLNARLQKLKARGHDVSRLEENLLNDTLNVNEGEISEIEKELSRLTIPSISMEANHMISSRSDKEFRPILNLTDENYEEKGKERKKSKENMTKENRNAKGQKPNMRKSQGVSVEGNENKNTPRELKKTNPKRSTLDPKKRKDNPNISVNKESQKPTKKSVENRTNVSKKTPKANVPKAKDKLQSTSERLLIEHDEVISEDLPQMDHSYDDENGHYGGITPSVTMLHVDDMGNEDEFTYNRSSTVNLEEELSSQKGYFTSQSKTPYQQTKEELSNWSTRTFPTERQQQILDQLQELRKGLLHKQREYERGTTPATGDFVNRG